MKDNNLIKILIPIVALIVVFESITLVSSLDKNSRETNKVEESSINTVDQNVQKEVLPVADLIWETENLEMKVGKSYKVVLNLLAKSDLSLDSVETHIYFDPKNVSVSKLETNKEIGEALKPTGIDNKKGYISAILWNEDTESKYSINADNTVEILSFMVTPKLEGEIDFDLSTSMTDDKLATIILESVTNKPLVYLTNKLKINATK